MAQLLNGTLKVENTPDGWVMFTLPLPGMELTTGESQLALKLPHYEFDKMRPTLLVIDDELEMLWFIGEIFSNDFNVVTLQDPERIEQVMNEVYPNVIICDVMMPVMDGITLCRKIKGSFNTNHIPVILLTAKSEDADRL